MSSQLGLPAIGGRAASFLQQFSGWRIHVCDGILSCKTCRRGTAVPDPRNTVAIVIPIHKNDLKWNEDISLRRCFEVFAGFPVILAVPERLDCRPLEKYGSFAAIKTFPDRFFASEKGYNHLLGLPLFYREFLDFEYMLIYQLDTFVFENNLLAWCAKGYDYVGAPWLDTTWVNEFFSGSALRRFFLQKRFNPVGNGGLSLRKVMSSWKAARKFRLLAAVFKHEDFLWSNIIARFLPGFNTAPASEALDFAFEEHPETLFEKNGRRLPFGCHSWEKYGTDFWRPHFLRYGYKI